MRRIICNRSGPAPRRDSSCPLSLSNWLQNSMFCSQLLGESDGVRGKPYVEDGSYKSGSALATTELGLA
jgi:hypothetical protein